METMKEYHDLYLKCDVVLLADVFEKFRNNSLNGYGSRPSHNLSTLVLSWDAVLNMKKILNKNLEKKLELTSDHDMYIFFETGMRGGVSYISNRYSKASNKYFESYDPQLGSKHIIYLDANSLYDYAMSKFLPTSLT